MKPIKDYIAEKFLGNTYHFKCDCLMALDVMGTVRDYEITSAGEILFHVDIDNKKMVKIGLNHPNLTIEKL